MTGVPPTRTTCPYCGVGCGVAATISDTGTTIAGDAVHPANFGRLCSKGSALGETLGLATRLLHPEIGGRRATWDEALDLVAARFSETIATHGPDSVAFYISGQLLTEDYYVANKLMKGFIGSANVDTNSRLCMSSAVAGHKRAFGADAVPGCYEDWELADLVVLVGSNTAWCHPILYQRLMAARAERGTRVVVIDPRRTATCDEADLHIAIDPGKDVRLFNALLATLAARGSVDSSYIEQHTTGFDAALAAARAVGFSPEAVAADCGADADSISTFFDWFVATPRTVTAFSQGVNQSSRGVDKVNAIINCHLATGRVGREGAGPFSITGQPNAMGGREVGGLANQLAAHMDFTDERNRERLARFWKSDHVANGPGLMAVDMFRAIKQGTIRAVWIMATNPAVSLPDAGEVREALRECPFVAVSDCVKGTDTMRFADVVLPAAAWGEKDGTVTNSERRISRQRPFAAPASEAKPDWWIISEVARRMGHGSAFPYRKPAEIFREHTALSGFENDGTRAFDVSGLAAVNDAAYDALEPVQWPIPAGTRAGTPRLFTEGEYFTPTRKARFVAVTPHAPANAPGEAFPFILNTGRVRDQWHTMTRTGLSPLLASHRPEPFVDVNPDDAKDLGLEDKSLARLSTRWGSGLYRVSVSAGQKRGQVFAPIHWTDENASNAVTGRAVNPMTDAISGQPEFKHTPASLAPFHAEWRGFLLTRERVAVPDCAYWARITTANGFLYEMAGGIGDAMPSIAAFAREDTPHSEWIEVVNQKRKDYRVARFEEGRLTDCLILTRAGVLPPRRWIAGLLSTEIVSADDRMTLLSGRALSPEPDDGPLVCACFRVGAKRIYRTIQEHSLSTVEEIGQYLKAGTNCGSCRPELRAMLAQCRREKAA